MHFQELVFRLQEFWGQHGCAVVTPYDMEMGAGTFHPDTTLRSLGPIPTKVAHVQPCRRPGDGRYGENPNRVQRFHQFQVLLKPAPAEAQDLLLESYKYIGLDPARYDIRFVEDDWESPTLGAWGLGWEVWCNGMEVTQYTYFQQVGGVDCELTSVEYAYGLERIAMILQNVDSILDINWNGKEGPEKITWGDLYKANEVEASHYNFDEADVKTLFTQFDRIEAEALRLCERELSLPAYEQCIKASHIFNLLDARGAISVTERAAYILRVRTLAKLCCNNYVAHTVAKYK